MRVEGNWQWDVDRLMAVSTKTNDKNPGKKLMNLLPARCS
jgi:hypothetical protein